MEKIILILIAVILLLILIIWIWRLKIRHTKNDPRKVIIICPNCNGIIQSPNEGLFEEMDIIEGEICPNCKNEIQKSFKRNKKYARQRKLKKGGFYKAF